jgi:uncharacterized protein
MKKAHPHSALVWALVAAIALSSGACRKAAPDEMVHTGTTKTKTPVGAGGSGAPTSSATGSGAVGGATTGGAGSAGRGGTGGDGEGGSDPGPDVPFSKAALLAAAADCAQERYGNFRERAQVLADKARAAAEDANDAFATAAREAWLSAITSWQEAELFRFGPAAGMLEQPGGQGLRDHIYSWPLLSRCTIEQQIVTLAFKDHSFPSSLISGRGLGAIEYLLFYGGTDNACSNFVSINAQGTWVALGGAELARRKAQYAAAAADDVLARANALLGSWTSSPNGYREQLVSAGAGSVLFVTDHKGLNAVSDALFYVDRELKDWKLGRPIGLIDCLAPTCPEAIESQFAAVSTLHLRANLVGFRRLFQGCRQGFTGLGFEDWLRAVGATDLADRMIAALRGAEAAVDELHPPIEQAIVNDPAKVFAVHRAVKVLTDLLKAEFVTALNLELPKSAPSDTD